MKFRLPAIVASLTIAIAIAAALLYFLDIFGGDDKASARDILERAAAAFEEPENAGLRSYHAVGEMSIERAEDADKGNGLDDPSIALATIPTPPQPPTTTEMRIWFAVPARSRIELQTTASGETLDTRIIVSNGSTDWYYESDSNRYAQQPAEPIDREHDTRYFVGPGAFVDSLDDLLAEKEASTNRRIEVVGDEEIDGRKAYVIEISDREDEDEEPDPFRDRFQSTTRIYLDKEFLFTLAWETTIGNQTLGFRFRDVEFNNDIEDGIFEFTPPLGAVEAAPEEVHPFNTGSGSSSSSGSGESVVELPVGFFVPTYFPTNFLSRETSSAMREHVAFRASFLLREEDGDGYVSAQERRDVPAVPSELQTGNTVTVRGQAAWLDDRDGLLRLAWQEGDLIIYMISRGVSEEDLLHVVGSMQPSTGDEGPYFSN